MYDLTLEDHTDVARTRALMRIYDVEQALGAPDDDETTYVIKSSYGWFDEEAGRIRLTDYNFRGAPESAGPTRGTTR